MNRRTVLLVAAAVLLVFSGLEYYLEAQPTEFPLGIGAELGHVKTDLHQDDFNREDCERDCRERYGVVFGRRDDPQARLYARCIQECERLFWRQFDRRTKELEREE